MLLPVNVFSIYALCALTTLLELLPGVQMQTFYNMNAMEVKMHKDTISVAIKDMPGMESVKYTIIRNCPLRNEIDVHSLPEEYSYGLTSPTNGLWRMEIATQWNDYDLICLDADIIHRGRRYEQHTPPLRISDLRRGTICELSQTMTAFGNMDICTNALIFNDEFINLNNSIWRMDVRIGLYQLDEEFVVFDDSVENSFVQNRNLHILPKLVQGDLKSGQLNLGIKCTALDISECELKIDAAYKVLPPIRSAMLTTRNSFHFTYGRVEIKAKLPKGDWLFPYVSLQTVSNYQRAEIRIAFARGNEVLQDSRNRDVSGRRLYAGTIYWDRKKEKHYNMKELEREHHFGDDFHTYSITWMPQSISFAVDGNVFGEITENMDIFQQPFHMALGVSAGGHNEFKSVPTKPWTDTSAWAALNFYKNCDVWGKTWKNGNEALIVDYVRVYAI